MRVGLSPTTTAKDAQITAAKDAAFSLMGNYCDRVFPLAVDEKEVFTHLTGGTIRLKRYPIASVLSIVAADSKAITLYHMEGDTGVIHLDAHWAFHQVTVTFTGGYDEEALPTDLLMAFYSVFDQEYALAAGDAVSTGGEIASVTVADVGTIRYNTSADEGSSGEGAFLPARAQRILEDYKRYKC